MMMINQVHQIGVFIAENRLGKALHELERIDSCNNQQYNSTIIILKRMYTEIKVIEWKNIATQDEVIIMKNKIANSILDIVAEMTQGRNSNDLTD